MNREKVEDVLLEMGVPSRIKGFAYIADAIEYIEEHGTDVSITKEIYPFIAEKNKDIPARVERAIRHAFEVVRSYKGDREIVEKYIGFINCENFSSIVMLYKKIKRECDDSKNYFQKEKGNAGKSKGVTASEIREIIRQELRMFLNEMQIASRNLN